MKSNQSSNLKSFLRKLVDIKSKRFLFIVWGTLLFFSRMIGFLKSEILLTYRFISLLKYFKFLLLFIGVALTIWYFYINRSRFLEQERVIARYTWLAIFIANNLILMILKARYHEIDFAITHLIQMGLIGLALLIVGTVMKENYIRIAGVLFWIALFLAIDLSLEQQFLYEAIVVAIGVILPVKLIAFREIRKN